MGSLSRPDIPKPWHETPLIESAALSRAAGCRIFLKLENLQPSGSFKSRGVGNLIRREVLASCPTVPLHFYSSSGGNAGLACVTAARALDYPATVVVPTLTSALMISKLRSAGVTEVIQIGANWREADRHLREEILTKDPNGVYVPPFDHQNIWDGNSTLIEELAEQTGDFDALVCSVGGGGLFCGLMEGLDKVYGDKVNKMRVLALETKGAESLNKSLQEGHPVLLDRISSIATSLGAPRVAERAFELGQRNHVTSVVLEDGEAAMGCWRLADDERLLVEPACGVSVAVCYDGRLKKLIPDLNEESKVVIVVCGGSGVTFELLAEWRKLYGQVEEKIDVDVPSSLGAPPVTADA